jgi:hypothetical protein
MEEDDVFCIQGDNSGTMELLMSVLETSQWYYEQLLIRKTKKY